jgi:uncharacterized protein YoxC
VVEAKKIADGIDKLSKPSIENVLGDLKGLDQTISTLHAAIQQKQTTLQQLLISVKQVQNTVDRQKLNAREQQLTKEKNNRFVASLVN